MPFLSTALSFLGFNSHEWRSLKRLQAGAIPLENARISLAQEARQHAILLVEYYDNNNIYNAYKVHLRGKFILRDPLQMLSHPQAVHFGFYRQGAVEVLDLSNKPSIRILELGRQWDVNKKDAQYLLDYAKQENNSHFNILGNGSLSSSIASSFFNQRSNNCYTWARERLMITGINIQESAHWKLLSATGEETQNMRFTPVANSVTPLCHFARSNDLRSMERWYQHSPEVNQKASRATKGPCESILGSYTPLMLSAAYGHHEAVSYLINDLKANPYINTLPTLGFGLLGRYSAFDCSKSLLFRPYIGKSKQQTVAHALSQIDHKTLIHNAIRDYILQRNSNPNEHTSRLTFFGHTLVNFGCSRKEKLEAAESYLKWLDDPRIDLSPYKRALSQGELGKMVADYKKYGQHESDIIRADMPVLSP